jgi:basic amino acid/polyamine antiporter, APA family
VIFVGYSLVTKNKNYNLLERPARINEQAAPKPSLGFLDAVALIVGIVIGAGIFETPAFVAANAASGIEILVLWSLGGAISLIGGLCYAELATTYPNVGGTYYYLKRAFGRQISFLFAWSRMTVIQTGSIALQAFIFGDYAGGLFNLGAYSSSIYAIIAVLIISGLNIIGFYPGKWTQNLLTVVKVLGLLLVILIGIFSPTATEEPVLQMSLDLSTWGTAMVFVLLTYGGWNEAAYISAEIRNGRRNIVRSLIVSIGIITAIYVLINFAFLQGLGLEQMAKSQAIGATLMDKKFGAAGSIFLSILVIVSALGATNATILTGARTNYALGQDFSVFRFMGRWQQQKDTPTQALIIQAAVVIVLIILGTLTRNGFETMVDYTAPIFWFFFLLSGLSLFVLRIREPDTKRPFQVPFYPLTPLLFCGVCGYLLYSSLAYTGVGAILGVVVVGLGIPFLFWNERR